MDLMRDWLGPTIEDRLERALEWKEQGSAGSRTAERIAFEDDGSNLRVRLKKVDEKARFLQIVKFTSFEDPIRAVLSDSHSSIRATFASATVRAYSEKHRKRITEGTKGGIIAIAQYEIVATHLGPEQASITLLIQDLHFRGCEGSSTFGNPVQIQQRRGVAVLIPRLRQLKNVEVSDDTEVVERAKQTTPSPVRSQLGAVTATNGSPTDGSDSAMATQVGFHSQMPRSRNTSTTVVDKSESAQSPSLLPRGGRTVPDAYRRATAAVSKTVNTNEDLRGLLERAQTHKTAESRTKESPRVLNAINTSSNRSPLDFSTNLEKGAQKTEIAQHTDNDQAGYHVSTSERLLDNDQVKPTETLQPEANRVSVNLNVDMTRKVPVAENRNAEQLKCEESAVCTTKGPGDNVKGPSPGKVPNQLVAAIKGVDRHVQTSENFSPPLAEANMVDGEDNTDPWTGMTRIRRRDVRISKEQQKLLDHDDSWIPPEPGRRGPIANVPIAILQTLNAAAEHPTASAKLVETSPEIAKPGNTELQHGSLSTGSEAEEDFDEEVLSGWSSSSLPSVPGDQLPPDSSFGVPEESSQPKTKNVLSDSTAISNRHILMTPTAPRNRVRSVFSIPQEAVQADQLGSFLASKSENGSSGEDPVEEAGLLADTDKAMSTQLSEPVAESTNVQTNGIDMEDDPLEPTIPVKVQANKPLPQLNETQGHIEEDFLSPQETGAAAAHEHSLGTPSHIKSGHSLDLGSEDDNLESMLPQALGDELIELDDELANGQGSPSLPPSTALQWRKPTLQVKRTPYPFGGAPRSSPPNSAAFVSSSPKLSELALHLTRGEVSTSLANLAEDIIPGTHYAQTNPTVADISSRSLGLDGAEEDVDMNDEEAMIEQQLHSEIDAHSQRDQSLSPCKSRSSGLGSPAIEQKEIPRLLPVKNPFDQIPSLPTVEEIEHGKRKAVDLDQLSPFVTKRRKRVKPPPAFNFSQDNRQTQDPSLLAKQHRREFFASRSVDYVDTLDGEVETANLEEDQMEVKADEATQSSANSSTKGTLVDPAQQRPENRVEARTSGLIRYKTDSGLSDYKPQLMSGELTSQDDVSALGDTPDKSIKSAGYPTVHKPPSVLTSTPSTTLHPKSSVYDTFRSTYPDYLGGSKHFLTMCDRINKLLQADHMEHPSLWDDFVIRHNREYRDYLLECTDSGDDPMSYERFYREHIDEPKYNKRILTPAVLKDLIASVGKPDPALLGETSLPNSAKVLVPTVIASTVDLSPREPRSEKPGREEIDLTLEDAITTDASFPKKPSRLRPLPWTKPAQVMQKSPASRVSIRTPKSSLTGQESTFTQTPSRKVRRPQEIMQERVPSQVRSDVDLPRSITTTDQAVNDLPDTHKSPSRPKTSESNRSTVVEWLENTSSRTASSVIPESKPVREENKEDQWWRDRNTPFKAFTRAYARLKSVDGSMGKIDQEGILRVEPRRLDVLKWKI